MYFYDAHCILYSVSFEESSKARIILDENFLRKATINPKTALVKKRRPNTDTSFIEKQVRFEQSRQVKDKL